MAVKPRLTWSDVGNGYNDDGREILVLNLFFPKFVENYVKETAPKQVTFPEESIVPEDVMFQVADTLPDATTLLIKLILMR